MEQRIEADIPILGKVYVNLVDLASQVFNIYKKEDEIIRQKDMSHLGLISKAFKGINHSRYDYLILQCVISELVDNNFKGTTSAQGSIKINKKEYSGNDVIKTWFLLSNFGHCKNTIGDEKTFLLKAIQSKGFKSVLLSPLKNDTELKSWAEKVISDFDYLNFHHILAIRRIYKCLPRRVKDQKTIISVYLNSKSQTYYRSYELNALDVLSLGRDHKGNIEKAVKEGLADPNDCKLSHFLRIELHIDNVREKHLADAIRNSLTVKRGVQNVEASVDYNPFTSVRVIDFYLLETQFELRDFPKFLTNISGILENQLQGTIDNQISQRKSVLVGLEDGATKLGLNINQKKILQESIKQKVIVEFWNQVDEKNISVFKEILWSVLKFHLKDNFYFDIDHHTSKEFRYFGVKSDGKFDSLTEDIKKAVELIQDQDRTHELQQLLKSTKRKFAGTTIACLSRITIYDYSKAPSHRKVTDIDSLLLKFNADEMVLELHESKNTKNPSRDAKRDLKEKLAKTLNENSVGYRIREVKGMGAKIVIKRTSNPKPHI